MRDLSYHIALFCRKRHADQKELCRLVGKLDNIVFLIKHHFRLKALIVQMRSEDFQLITFGKDILDFDQGNIAAWFKMMDIGDIVVGHPGAIDAIEMFGIITIPLQKAIITRTVFRLGKFIVVVCESIRTQLSLFIDLIDHLSIRLDDLTDVVFRLHASFNL